jgi:hypothetical protein
MAPRKTGHPARRNPVAVNLARRQQKPFRLPAFLRSEEAAYRWALKHTDIRNQWPVEDEAAERADLRDRIGDYVWKADEIASRGWARIWREVTIPAEADPVEFIDWRCIGKAWSAELQGAGTQGVVPYKGERQRVVLEARVRARDIDWAYGFTSFIYYGRDQWEISLLEDAPVRVEAIVARKYRYDRETVRTALSPPILANTGTSGESWADSCRQRA